MKVWLPYLTNKFDIILLIVLATGLFEKSCGEHNFRGQYRQVLKVQGKFWHDICHANLWQICFLAKKMAKIAIFKEILGHLEKNMV